MAVSDMLGVANKCQSSYGTDGMLNIPCVRVSRVLYAATLQQISAAATETQFTLTSATPIEEAQESKNVCEATYSLETGRLDIPCIANLTENMLLRANNFTTPTYFTVETMSIRSKVRAGNPSYLFGHPVASFVSQIQKCIYAKDTCYKYGLYHTGIDYWNSGSSAPYSHSSDIIISIGDGVIEKINRLSGNDDHGLGNNVIIKHRLLNGEVIYSLYAHMYSIDSGLQVGNMISKGGRIGIMGASGSGSLTKWSDEIGRNNVHLHFEIKDSAVTNNPVGQSIYYGYTPSSPNGYGYHDPNVYIGKVEFVPNRIITSFDGAGSLISPTQTGVGANRDIAIMQPHADIGTTSTVVFQFKKDANCDHVDISSTPNIDAIIQSKYWQDHLISTAFGAALPVSVSTSKGGFAVVAVTSAIPRTSSVIINAQCKPISSPRINAVTTPFTDEASQLVTLGDDYYWTGTGSIISSLGTGTAKTADIVPTFDTKKSFSSFQWRTTTACSRLELYPPNNGMTVYLDSSSSAKNEVSLKLWNSPTWQTQSSCTSLPCTISAPSIGEYYIVKVKTNAGALTGTSGVTNNGYVNAKCK